MAKIRISNIAGGDAKEFAYDRRAGLSAAAIRHALDVAGVAFGGYSITSSDPDAQDGAYAELEQIEEDRDQV